MVPPPPTAQISSLPFQPRSVKVVSWRVGELARRWGWERWWWFEGGGFPCVRARPCALTNDAVTTGLDRDGLEVGGVGLKVAALGNLEQTAVEAHPDSVGRLAINETHVLNTARSAAVVRDPEVWWVGAGGAGEGEVEVNRGDRDDG